FMAGATRLVDRFRRGDLRLDRHRDGPAALGRVRVAANRGRGVTPRHPHGGHHPRAVRTGLRRRRSRWASITSTGSSHAGRKILRLSPSPSERTRCRCPRLEGTDAKSWSRRKHRGGVMESYLPVIWAAIIGLAVAMYVIL